MGKRSVQLILLSIVALAALGSASVTDAQEQSDLQQRCITAVTAAACGVAKAQGKANAACLHAALQAGGTTLESCLSTDSKSVTKARTRLANTVTSRCATPPDFGFTSAEIAGGSATAQEISLFDDVFGDDPSSAVTFGRTNAANASCQRATQKAYERVLQAELREFRTCTNDGLKSGEIASQASLAACSSAMTEDATARIAKTIAKLDYVIDSRCAGVDVTAAFPGRCAHAFAGECIRTISLCRACLLLDEADDTGASCDLLDNGVADDSCNHCGNGRVDPGEECDDGNRLDGDCCSRDCKLETCHEHVVASNLVIVYTKSFVPNAPGGFDAQDPMDKRSIETVVRVDPTIDIDLSGGAPPDTFFYHYMYSIRWTGSLEVPATGSYSFEITTGNDGIGRLFIDGAPIAQKTAFNTVPVTAAVNLTGGRHEIRFDFVDYWYALGLRLRWRQPGQESFSTISPSSLYPVVDGTTSGGLTGTYYATPLFMDKVEQLRKYYRDMRRWVWINTGLSLDTQFDVRVIDAPLNLSRYDQGFMGPDFVDEEGRSVWGDVMALGLRPNDFASVAAWSPPLLTPDSRGVEGVRQGFFAAGATVGPSTDYPTYSSIQLEIIPAELTEFGLRVRNWFEYPVSEHDIYPNNHSYPEFIASAPDGFGDSMLFPYHAISYRRVDLQDWKLLLARPGGFAVVRTPDADGDGIPDGSTDVPVNEADFSSNPLSADTDGDGLSDFEELTRGFSQPTNPLQADTDGDGVPDGDDKHPRFPIQETILRSSPVRDGTVGASEYGDPLITVNDPNRPSDFTGTLWVTWNAAGLNVALKVIDDSFDPPDYSTFDYFTYGGDQIRVRLDMANDGFFTNPPSMYSDNLEIWVAPLGDPASPARYASIHRYDASGYFEDYDAVPGSSIPASYQRTSDGYVVEFLVPTNDLIGFTPALCTPFAMQVEVYDRDEHQDGDQLRYQFFREGAASIVHYVDYQCDFPTSEGSGGLGAFASLVLADSRDQDCNHAPTVETIADQVVRIGDKPLRLSIRGSDRDRDRLALSATVDGGQPLSAVGATFEDRGINLGILRWDPQSEGSHLVTVIAADPQGASGRSSFSLIAQPPS